MTLGNKLDELGLKPETTIFQRITMKLKNKLDERGLDPGSAKPRKIMQTV